MKILLCLEQIEPNSSYMSKANCDEGIKENLILKVVSRSFDKRTIKNTVGDRRQWSDDIYYTNNFY